MSSEIVKALNFLCEEKGLEHATVLEALESALAAAYRKDFGNRQGNYKVKFDPETGDMRVWDVKEVVADIDEETLEQAQEELIRLRETAKAEGRELTEEEVADVPHFNPKTEIMLADAGAVKYDTEIGDILEIPQETPSDFGRMAAQTAKQVIIQKLREAERITVFEDFKRQEGKMMQGIIQRRDRGGAVIVDFGKITGIVPSSDQIEREMYRPGARMQFFVVSVTMGARGPEILLSRTDKRMVQYTFAEEIPEIGNGEVMIKAIAREPGVRSKVAVHTDDDTIDPIGSCIGQRGSRITIIIQALGGEKIDIIQWSNDPALFIKHALSPAKVVGVDIKGETGEAMAHVSEDQFSLAIGRGGQNVRLAAELTGYKINVVQVGNTEVEVSSGDTPEEVEEKVAVELAQETIKNVHVKEIAKDEQEGKSENE